MLITAPPGQAEHLEGKAARYDQRADECDAGGLPLTALHLRKQAAALRAQAEALRSRRTDGVRFG